MKVSKEKSKESREETEMRGGARQGGHRDQRGQLREEGERSSDREERLLHMAMGRREGGRWGSRGRKVKEGVNNEKDSERRVEGGCH